MLVTYLSQDYLYKKEFAIRTNLSSINFFLVSLILVAIQFIAQNTLGGVIKIKITIMNTYLPY